MKRISLFSSLLLLVANPAAAQRLASQSEAGCSDADLMCRLEGIGPRPRSSESLNGSGAHPTAAGASDGFHFGVIRFGDTIPEIARRYSLTIAQLLRLNPGLDASRLVIGSTIRIAHPVKRDHWAVAVPLVSSPLPLASPPPSQPPTQFDTTVHSLVSEGIISPVDRVRVRRGLLSQMSASHYDACSFGALSNVECTNGLFTDYQRREACNSGALSSSECRSGVMIRRGSSIGTNPVTISLPLSSREQALLNRIRQDYQPTWRRFGSCKYDWTGWKLNSSGVRTTSVECGSTSIRSQVGVSCNRLLVANHSTSRGWSKWDRPAGPESGSRSGEDEMVAALCANASK